MDTQRAVHGEQAHIRRQEWHSTQVECKLVNSLASASRRLADGEPRDDQGKNMLVRTFLFPQQVADNYVHVYFSLHHGTILPVNRL